MRFAPLVPMPKPTDSGKRKPQRSRLGLSYVAPRVQSYWEPATSEPVELPPGILPKLEVGAVNDPLEREADAIADRVMRMPAPRQEFFDSGPTFDLDLDSDIEREDELTEAPTVGAFAGGAALPEGPGNVAHRKCSSCEDEDTVHRVVDEDDQLQRMCTSCEEEEDLRRAIQDYELQRACASCAVEDEIQRVHATYNLDARAALQRTWRATMRRKHESENVQEAAAGRRGGLVTADFDVRLRSRVRSGGALLPSAAREFLEPRIGVDLGHVRVHTDAQAGLLARSINARAFTKGDDVFFASGEWRPHSHSGMRLLAHEVAHTLQNRSPASLTPPASSVAPVVRRSPPNERTTGGGNSGSASAVWELLNADIFCPDESLHNYLKAHQNRARINVRFGPHASGSIAIERRILFEPAILPPSMVFGGYCKNMYTVGSDEECTIPFNPPSLPSDSLGLRITIKQGEISGYVVSKDGSLGTSLWSLAQAMKGGIPGSVFGLDSIANIRSGHHENEISHGQLKFGLHELTFETIADPDHPEATQPVVEGEGRELGLNHLGFWTKDMALNLVADGLASSSLPFKFMNDGSPFGTVGTSFEVSGIKGNAQATFIDGHLEATGSATLEKFQIREGVFVGGTVSASLTSRAEANETLLEILNPYVGEHNDVRISSPSAEEASRLALIAWGELSFSFNDDTLYGTAVAVLDSDHGLTAAGHLLTNLEIPLFKPPIERSYELMKPKSWSINVAGIKWLAGIEAFLEAAVSAGFKIGEGKIYGFELKGIISTSNDIGRHFEVKGHMQIPGHAWLGVNVDIGLRASVLMVEVAEVSLNFVGMAYVPGILQAELSTHMSSSNSNAEPGEDVEVLGLGNDMNTKLGFAGSLLCEGQIILRLFGRGKARIGRERKRKKGEGKGRKKWNNWNAELFDVAYNIGGGHVAVSTAHVFGMGESQHLGHADQLEWKSGLETSSELDELGQSILREDKERLLGEDSEENRGYGSEEELEAAQKRELGEGEGDDEDNGLGLSAANLDGRELSFAGDQYFVFDALRRPSKKSGESGHYLSLAVYPDARLFIEADVEPVISYLQGRTGEAKQVLERAKLDEMSTSEELKAKVQLLGDLEVAMKIVSKLEARTRTAYALKRWAKEHEHRPMQEEVAADPKFESENIDEYDHALRQLVSEFYSATDPVRFLAGFAEFSNISQGYLQGRSKFFVVSSEPYSSDLAKEESDPSDNPSDGEDTSEYSPRACLDGAPKLPSGRLEPRLFERGDGNYALGPVPFRMIINFRNDDTGCDCSLGEYRQFIRGFVHYAPEGDRVMDAPANITWPGLRADGYREQVRVPQEGYVFGHRDQPAARSDMFRFDRPTGCYYQGQSIVAARNLDPGSYVHVNFEFKGKAIDRSNPDRVLGPESHWWFKWCGYLPRIGKPLSPFSCVRVGDRPEDWVLRLVRSDADADGDEEDD